MPRHKEFFLLVGSKFLIPDSVGLLLDSEFQVLNSKFHRCGQTVRLQYTRIILYVDIQSDPTSSNATKILGLLYGRCCPPLLLLLNAAAAIGLI